METQRTFKVVLTSILALPESRERAILARKALALHAGCRDTSGLREHGVQTDEDSYELLSTLAESVTGLVVRSGYEPADPGDAWGEVSLEEFAREQEAGQAEEAREALRALRGLVEEGNWEEAADAAIGGFLSSEGRARRRIVALLEVIAGHEERAAVFFGRALVRGEGIRKDVSRGCDLLRRAVACDDATTSGYAHLLLGEVLMAMPGHGFEAIRNFEGAAYLGWEDGSEYAGVLCQLGLDGNPPDFARAAKNFRYGISKGQHGCMAKYALMVLSGQVDYDPQWLTHYRRALEMDDHVAMHFYPIVLETQERSGGDMDTFLDLFRERYAAEVEVAAEVDMPDYVIAPA